MLGLEQGNIFFLLAYHITTITCCIFIGNFLKKGLLVSLGYFV